MGTKASILIVEDNSDHLELFTDAFTPEYEVIPASSGEECLELVADRPCDLVILDYYLSSRFSGLDILKEITAKDPNLPVVMVTAYGNEELAVKAMKIGAKDYIRKTLDNTYIERIHKHVQDILRRKSFEKAPNVKQQVMSFLEENRARFIKGWQAIMRDFRKRIDLPDSFLLQDNDINRFFSAFLADIQNDRPTETTLFLKKMILLQEAEEKSLLATELLNVSFKEMARVMVKEEFPDSLENRTIVMSHIGTIVDENDLELSKEYEKLIWLASKRARQSERIATKSILLTTLQHEIRQPLAYILNTAEMLQMNRESVGEEALAELVKQTRRIEKQLDRLERDSQMHTKQYSEGLRMIDLPESAE